MSIDQFDANEAQKPAQRTTRPLWHAPVRAGMLLGALVGGSAVGFLGYIVSGGTLAGFILAGMAVIGYTLVLAAMDWLIFG